MSAVDCTDYISAQTYVAANRSDMLTCSVVKPDVSLEYSNCAIPHGGFAGVHRHWKKPQTVCLLVVYLSGQYV